MKYSYYKPVNRPRGWFGHSREHALAAKGHKLYSQKQRLVDPVFYAQKREQDLPFTSIQSMVREGLSFEDMKKKAPDADVEDLRLRGIKAVESVDGGSVLSTINRNGVDESVALAKRNPAMLAKMRAALADRQKSSFIQSVKVKLLRERLDELKV